MSDIDSEGGTASTKQIVFYDAETDEELVDLGEASGFSSPDVGDEITLSVGQFETLEDVSGHISEMREEVTVTSVDRDYAAITLTDEEPSQTFYIQTTKVYVEKNR